MNILEQFKNVYSNHLIPKGFSLLKSNPLMKLIRECKEKEFKEKHMGYNQWFIDRKKGGPEYDRYMEDATKNENTNRKYLEKLGAIFQVKSFTESAHSNVC